MTRILTTLAIVLLGAPAIAGDDARPTSRHTFRTHQIDAGGADRLARPIAEAQVRIVRAQPLRGDASRTTSTVSSSTSNLTGASSRTAVSAVRATPTAPATAVSIVRRATPLVAMTAQEGEQPQIDDRAAVDNNARLAANYRVYAPATITHEQAQLALGAHRVQQVGYANTYGTYSPESYHGRLTYASYPSRTYYYPTGYYGHRTYSYGSYYPYHSYRTYSPTYCAPVYYRPTYCAPTYYHRPSYSYCAPRYYSSYGSYYRPSYSSFRYSYSRHCGSRFGFSIGW